MVGNKARESNNIVFGRSRVQLSPSAPEISAQNSEQNLWLMRTSGWTHLSERLQAAARRIKFGEPAAFLFDQVIFISAAAFGRLENIFPLGGAFPEQNFVTFLRFRRPVLQMERANSPRIG